MPNTLVLGKIKIGLSWCNLVIFIETWPSLQIPSFFSDGFSGYMRALNENC